MKDNLWTNSLLRVCAPVPMALIGSLGSMPLWLNAFADVAWLQWGAVFTSVALLAGCTQWVASHDVNTKSGPSEYGFRFWLNTFGVWSLCAFALAISWFSLETGVAMVITVLVGLLMPGMLGSFWTQPINTALNPLSWVVIGLKTLPLSMVFFSGLMVSAAGAWALHQTIAMFFPSLIALQMSAIFSVFSFVLLIQFFANSLAKLSQDATQDFESPSPAKIAAQETISSQATQQTITVLESELERHPEDLTLLKKVFEYHFELNSPKTECMAERYLVQLVESGHKISIIRVTEQMLKRCPSYKCQSIETVFRVAKILFEAQKYSLLVQLLRELHVKYDSHALIPTAYGTLAKVLFEQFGKDQEAVQVLEYVLLSHPDSPNLAKLKSQLDHIKKFQQEL